MLLFVLLEQCEFKVRERLRRGSTLCGRERLSPVVGVRQAQRKRQTYGYTVGARETDITFPIAGVRNIHDTSAVGGN